MKSAEMQDQSPWETEVYAQGRQINRWPHTEVVSRVLRATIDNNRNSTQVLELGCGTGNNLRFLAEEGFRPFGIDASQTAVAKARELMDRYGLEANLQTGDMAQLPWPDDHFDLLIDRAALVHNAPKRIQEIIKEARRVLKPGGRIFSIGLKSIRHPDLKFGQQGEDGAWSGFSHGKFRNLGDMSFFHAADIKALFSDFDIENAEMLIRTTLDGKILDEEFFVEAIRK